MRVALSEEELSGFLGNAREEARKNFGSALVYVEKYVERPRHVEVQIFGDAHGNILHFGTRDCSTQRRHQKLVEEAPAPGLSPNLRRDIHEAAVKAARSVNYQNAGTVEFMVAGNNFYFLEINTRIQVEHPITEIITGIDLVELQLRVARGEKLPLSQRQVNFDGHAIEFRIYAEDPSYKFMPVAGKIFSMPSSFDGLDYVRLDRGFESGDVLSTHYDAMIAKVIVQGDNREQALQRSEEVLKSFRIEGPPTTIPFHRWLLKLSPFRKGPLDVGYVERAFSQESLTALKASEILDPSHKEPESGAEHVETLRYGSKRFKTDYLINIYHEAGGTFLIEPGNPQGGGTAKRRYCRRSNGRQAALTSLIEEVLEKVVPEEVFA
jgi:acetyl/propionyl-CoA carboxylase alpha subunit